jgi:hypothetical protein
MGDRGTYKHCKGAMLGSPSQSCNGNGLCCVKAKVTRDFMLASVGKVRISADTGTESQNLSY